MCRLGTVRDSQNKATQKGDTPMKTKMRYLTALVVATAASGAAISFAPIAAAADPSTPNGPQATGSDTSGLDAPTGPGFWNGGQPAGGTGTVTGSDVGSGPSLWRGGQPAGGTGTATGPDVGSGAGYWSGGLSAGAVG
jgi:hypothetical protein